jgi:PEP-CTERM motif
MYKRLIITATLILLLLGAVTAQALLLDLTTVNLSGASGTTVNWDFTIYNDSGYDVSIDNIYGNGTLYGTNTTAANGYDMYGASAWGEFRGDSATMPMVASGTTYNGSLASFTIYGSAPAGAAVDGNIFLDYTLRDGDFNNKGIGTLMAQQGGADAVASVSVTAVPEPSTYLLLCIALGVVGFARKKMGQGNGQGLVKN